MRSSYVYAHAPTCHGFRNISLKEIRSQLHARKDLAAEDRSVSNANVGRQCGKKPNGLSCFVLNPESDAGAYGEGWRDAESPVQIEEGFETLLAEIAPIACRYGPRRSAAHERLQEQFELIPVVPDSACAAQHPGEPACLLGGNLAFDAIFHVDAPSRQDSNGSPMIPAFHGLHSRRKEDRGQKYKPKQVTTSVGLPAKFRRLH